jgi:hypothetical protein
VNIENELDASSGKGVEFPLFPPLLIIIKAAPLVLC